MLVSLASGLINGGFAGLFWTFLGTVLCYSSIVASLAEMESMAPTSGGQYHWVSEFAPASSQKLLSYAAGWMSTLGWLASVASSVFVCSTLVQSLVEITDEEFVFPNWQYTLLSIAFLVITIFFNTWGARSLPMIETVSLFGHVLCFVVTIVPLWVMCPKNSAKVVFATFVDSGGWGNIGTACLVSQVSVLYCNLGEIYNVYVSNLADNTYRLGLRMSHFRGSFGRRLDGATSDVVVICPECPSWYTYADHHALLYRYSGRSCQC